MGRCMMGRDAGFEKPGKGVALIPCQEKEGKGGEGRCHGRGGSRFGRDQRQLGLEVGSDRFFVGFPSLHVSRGSVLQLHLFLLFGNNHGLEHTLEFHLGLGGWILSPREVPSSSTGNFDDHCYWRLDTVHSHAGSSLLNSQCCGSPNADWWFLLPSEVMQ